MSKLTEIAEIERKAELARNNYQPSKEYSSNHPNALSDGDEKGKGETATIGSATDISERKKNAARNQYGINKPYDHKSL